MAAKNIESGLKELTDKLERIETSLREINQKIHAEQIALADALAHGGNPGRHQSEILKLGIDADSLRVSQASFLVEYQTIKAELFEVEKATAVQRLNELEAEYKPCLGNVIKALNTLIAEEPTMRRCYSEATALSRRYGLSSDIGLATIAIGSSSLSDHSESCLGVIRRNCPSFYLREA